MRTTNPKNEVEINVSYFFNMGYFHFLVLLIGHQIFDFLSLFSPFLHVCVLCCRECGAETFVNFTSFERDGKLPYNW